MSEETQQQIIDRFSKLGKIGHLDILNKIPEKERRYKCHICYLIVNESPCPNCKETKLEIMCPLDHCHCTHDIVSGVRYCPLCGEAICPECGSHDVSQVSRVTGYLSDVGGWNGAKQQELKDRVRVNDITNIG